MEACHRLALREGQKENTVETEGEIKTRTTKMLKLSVILILAVMLAINFQAVFAISSSTSGMSLHDYIVRFAEYKSKGNATECARIIDEMTTAEQIKEEKIASTNGAILQAPDSSSQISLTSVSPMTTTYGWMSYVIGYTPPTYDIVTGYIVGDIQYPNNVAGQPDGNYALLWTDGWNENYNNPLGGEAFAEGAVWNGQSGCLTGSVWVRAYTSQPSWNNYVIASYFDGSAWHYFAPTYYGQVHCYLSDVYIGTTSANIYQIAVECWTPPPYPQYYSPLILNYVWVDSVKIG